MFHKISMRGPRYYLILLILVAEIGWTRLKIDFLMNSKISHFMVLVVNFERDRLPTYFKSATVNNR